MISKLLRLYKRSHGLRQICNIAVYIVHSACTIHLLNLPSGDKGAKRDIVHGVKHLEEIAESWLCARRTLGMLSALARNWNVDLPDEASTVLARTDAKFGNFALQTPSPSTSHPRVRQPVAPTAFVPQSTWQEPAALPVSTSSYFNTAPFPVTANGAINNGGPVQTISSEYALPPQDANGLRALQYSSATTTPSSKKGQLPNGGTTTTQGSPSDMFGGVSQLLKDSQDWVYRDQVQFALGFENWNALDTMDPAAWPAAAVGDTGATGVIAGAPGPGNMPLVAADPTYNVNGVPAANGGGIPPRTNNVDPYYRMATYNENEWYQ